MKKLTFIFSLTFLALTLFSCKEEVDINTEYKDTPIIYGLLDQSEDLHFIKINRGFIGPGNALDFAKIPDSNYFENVTGKVDEIIGGQVARSWSLRDTLLNDKQTNGAFFGPQYKAYYFSTLNEESLKTEATYRLYVDINNGKLQVTGETQLVSGFAENVPISSLTSSLKFVKLPGEFTAQSVIFSKGNSAFANANFDILISEYRGTQKDTIVIPWKLFEGETSGNQYGTSAQGQSFYEIIKAGLTNDNTITKRNLEGIRVNLTGGSTDFFNYVSVSKPSSSLSQNKSTFTNLKVTGDHQVIGLFASRKTVSFYKPFINLNTSGNQTSFRCIDKNSTRELCQGTSLINFLFCSQHVNDGVEDFSCN